MPDDWVWIWRSRRLGRRQPEFESQTDQPVTHLESPAPVNHPWNDCPTPLLTRTNDADQQLSQHSRTACWLALAVDAALTYGRVLSQGSVWYVTSLSTNRLSLLLLSSWCDNKTHNVEEHLSVSSSPLVTLNRWQFLSWRRCVSPAVVGPHCQHVMRPFATSGVASYEALGMEIHKVWQWLLCSHLSKYFGKFVIAAAVV